MREYSISPRHTYNMVEKGFSIAVTSRKQGIFSKRMWDEEEVRHLFKMAHVGS
jgi:hypothetical protein